ncbi:hypothetical protein B0H66DRAFT_547601 [Apodospora peruviana]|uniref:Secreted protein n=1 Tax=Apodospora peruviana TaxID=516989 RepID=A0AAE0IHU1_9PEZI|nr:hypothetical protein B0H66DRAFT_547601 [Apodospora peruviana]
MLFPVFFAPLIPLTCQPPLPSLSASAATGDTCPRGERCLQTCGAVGSSVLTVSLMEGRWCSLDEPEVQTPNYPCILV